MDFDEALIRVQGALLTVKRAKGLQKDSNVDKDKNNKYSPLYIALRNVISEYKEKDADLRKIHLYILLNTDFKFNDEVIEDENFSHVVSTAPTLDKYLSVETVLMLDLQKYVCEAIVFGPTTLSIEYMDCILKTLQSNKSVEFILVTESIISAVHRKLIFLNFEIHQIELDNIDQLKRKFSHYFKELLNIYLPPHDDYKMGYVIKSLLSLFCTCLDQRLNPSSCEPCTLYNMSFTSSEDNCETSESIDIGKSEDIKVLFSIFESNLNLVNLTTWMYWSECEWKSTGIAEETRTIQEIVGEQAYHCKQQLQHMCNDFPGAATLSSVLTNMAIKPFSEDDEIERTEDLSKMVLKVKESNRSPELKKKWLIAMLKLPGSLKDDNCFECIEQFGNYFNNSEDILLLLERAAELIDNTTLEQQSVPVTLSFEGPLEMNDLEDSHKNNITTLVLKIFSQVSAEDQGKLIGLFYGKFGLTNVFLTQDFEKMATEVFNKAVNSEDKKDELISDLCALCLQSPRETVQRLLALATGCNSQIAFVIEVLKIISSTCQLKLEKQMFTKTNSEQTTSSEKIPLLCEELNFLMKRKHWNEIETSNFVHLIVNSHKDALLDQNNFLHDCFYPCIKDSLETSCWNAVDLSLETMNELVSTSCTTLEKTENPAILLVVILHILEKGRYDMREKLSVSAASTCELIISYLPLFLEKIVDQQSAQGKYITWLKDRVISATLFSQYYFNLLWSGKEEEVGVCKNYNSLLMQLFFQSPEFDAEKMMDLLKRQPKILRYHLFKVLPSCTTSEWINVTHVFKEIIRQNEGDHENLYLKLFIVLSDVLLVMITVSSKNITPNNKEAFYVIELWFKNFARIVKEEFWPCYKIFSIEKSCTIFQTIVNLLESIPKEEHIRETCSFLMMNILSDIIASVTQQVKNPYSDPMVLQLTTSISLISELETKKSLARKLLETIEKSCNIP